MIRARAMAILAMLGAACTHHSPPATLVQTIGVRNGHRYVGSEGEAPRVQATLLHTIGATDGSAAEFGSVRSVLLGPDGSLFVVDDRSHAVSRYDSNGVFAGKIGRDGSGPGEYRDPYSLAWLGKGLALLDPGNSRIALYDSMLRPANTWPGPRLTGGQVVRLHRTPPDFWAVGLRAEGKRLADIYIHYRASGPADTLPDVPPPDGLYDAAITCTGSDRSFTLLDNPLLPSQLVIPTPRDERAAVITNEYRIAFLDAGGDTTQVIERVAPAAPVTDSEWDSLSTDWKTTRARIPGAVCNHDGYSRPAAHPIISWIFYDDRGRLWVETASPGGARYDIFDPTGRLLATVDGLPATGGVDPGISGNRIALVEADPNGVPQVRVYRLEAK